MTNPYLIRLELLKLAQSIEEARYFAERQRIENDWSTKREFAMNNNHMGIPTELPLFPDIKAVDHQQVIDVATELNKFVSNEIKK
jgi:hypothetical protein